MYQSIIVIIIIVLYTQVIYEYNVPLELLLYSYAKSTHCYIETVYYDNLIHTTDEGSSQLLKLLV